MGLYRALCEEVARMPVGWTTSRSRRSCPPADRSSSGEPRLAPEAFQLRGRRPPSSWGVVSFTPSQQTTGANYVQTPLQRHPDTCDPTVPGPASAWACREGPRVPPALPQRALPGQAHPCALATARTPKSRELVSPSQQCPWHSDGAWLLVTFTSVC